jgi:hypothetical protein
MKANPLPGEQGAQQTTGEASKFIIQDDPARFISRGSAGDCCVLCGRCAADDASGIGTRVPTGNRRARRGGGAR